jgi:hypothetical protein
LVGSRLQAIIRSGLKLRLYTLWAINAALDERRLFQQLDAMRGWGFDGTVFHPRFYPNAPPYLGDEYLAILSRVIAHARSIGLEFWIYDENGWPSGTVGGELLRRYPADRQQWAELVENPPAAPDCLERFEHDQKHWYVARRHGDGVDYLKPELARHFLQMTYDRYRQGLTPAAFEHVSTFFCDEPEFGLGHAYDSPSIHGAIPWTDGIDGPLAPLFFPVDGYRQRRVQFWEALTDRFCASFIEPINAWCARHGKRFTAHVKGEEHPLFQVPMVGSCHQVFRHLALPGIDALGRDPAGNFFPRQAASAAQQFGNGDCMAECFGGAGWGAGPEDFERYLNWLVDNGLNHLVVHLCQYKLLTHAIQDWPASLPAHVNWREAFPTLLQRLRNRAATISNRTDTLLVAPYRGIMQVYEPAELRQINIHDASVYADSAAGRLNRHFLQQFKSLDASTACHVSDERTVEQFGRIEDGQLRLGNCAYRTVILSNGAQMDAQTRRLLKPLLPRGATAGCTTDRIQMEPEQASTIPVDWRLDEGSMNNLVLEATAGGDGHFAAEFQSAAALHVQIMFEDQVSDVQLNGARLSGEGGHTVPGHNQIVFTCAVVQPIPYLRVCGRFIVRSVAPYVAGPNRTVATEGPFIIDSAGQTEPGDLIACGFPFASEPLQLRGTAQFPDAAAWLQLTGVAADCARVQIGGVDCGWCWGPRWTVQLPRRLPAGLHAIQISLVPSTFNLYGPHHHIDGDPHVVSLGQYIYQRNPADRADAPVDTRVCRWHFKPLGLGRGIKIGQKPLVLPL